MFQTTLSILALLLALYLPVSYQGNNAPLHQNQTRISPANEAPPDDDDFRRCKLGPCPYPSPTPPPR